MGRHPCENCGEEGWDYSETYCPQSIENIDLCTYWDGRDICPNCLVLKECIKCNKDGCQYCIVKHCDDCKAVVCTDCKALLDIKVKFSSCGHLKCDTRSGEEDYCLDCIRKQQKNKTEEDAQHDTILLKSILPNIKTYELKNYISGWIRSHDDLEVKQSSKKRKL